jgi:hypothetical protein
MGYPGNGAADAADKVLDAENSARILFRAGLLQLVEGWTSLAETIRSATGGAAMLDAINAMGGQAFFPGEAEARP